MDRFVNFNRCVIVVMLSAAAIGLSLAADLGMAQERSLYERLGGRDAIVAVVDDFVANVAADQRINGFFAKTDIPRLKRLLVEQICVGTGGPCAYTGRDMKSAHRNMNVQEAHFGALVADLVRTLDKFKVPEREKGELLAILGPMKADIVGQ
jgi:hemoglobin